MIESRRSRNMTKDCYFHEDHGHDNNDCHELRHQIEEAVKSGQLYHLVKGIKKGKTKVSNTQQGDRKKENKETTPVKGPILMITGKTRLKRGSFSGEHSWPLGEVPLEITIGEGSLTRTENCHASNGNLSIHNLRGHKIPPPKGIGIMLSTHKPPERDERKKKSKATCSEIMKNFLSCRDNEERITVNTKYPEQIVAIRKQLPANIKEWL
ncbi:hypothetical protein Tco_1302118 [Tanacetum coccineum]